MLYIMRHGKTDWNAKHKLQGHADIPLNEEGRQMAENTMDLYLMSVTARRLYVQKRQRRFF